MSKSTVIAVTCLLFAPALAAKCLGDYPAPDKSAVVRVSSINKYQESLVVFMDAQGKVLHKEDYSSPDMNHGDVVDTCAWTPDAKFFVYSIYSSGGHQAWSFPTLFYARTENKLYSLNDLVGPTTEPDFNLTAPDIIHTTGWLTDKSAVHVTGSVPSESGQEPYYNYNVSLNQLLKKPHLPKSH